MSEFLSSKTVTTKKLHHCWGWWDPILPGSKVCRDGLASDGVAYSLYWCDECSTFYRDHPEYFEDSEELHEGDIGKEK